MGEFSCFAEASPLYLSRPTSSGHCEEWDSFDEAIALAVLEGDEK
jgi:hypothetical protein